MSRPVSFSLWNLIVLFVASAAIAILVYMTATAADSTLAAMKVKTIIG